ncbi:TVP38/TMEM64 family protein [Candidatus Pacearchaeota archaeon]|nr:TVP38/TMEM64 family protein [Candidatus Pacearchaeota archaeon]
MKYSKIIWYILTIIPIVLLILGYIYPSSFFSSQDQIRSFVESYGVFAPIIFVIIQILQVVLTPISHYAVGLAGGFIFGTWHGFILNWIGRVIGTLIAFYLGRKFGRRIIKHVVKQEKLAKYDKIFEKGKLILFLMYFLPIFPDDELSYLAGFSSMKARIFIPIMLLGHIGGSLGLAFLGSGLSYNNPLFIAFSLITLIAGILFVVFYKRHIKNN